MRVAKEGKNLWSRLMDCSGDVKLWTQPPCGSTLVVLHGDLFLSVPAKRVAFRCLICGCLTEVTKYDGPSVVRLEAPV